MLTCCISILTLSWLIKSVVSSANNRDRNLEQKGDHLYESGTTKALKLILEGLQN